MSELFEPLQTASILYFDDVRRQLTSIEEYFKRDEIPVQTTQSLPEVFEATASNNCDIFLCDLRLHEIGINDMGSNILKKIRHQNKDIFLGLYTSYKIDLSLSELRDL